MKSVLIIDDEPIVLDVLQRILLRLGFDTAVANSGKTALQIFARKLFDLILLDICMPDSTGFEIAKWIKETRPAQKIVVVTAIDKNTVITQCSAEDIDGVLPKPFTFEMLKSVVEKILNGENVFKQEEIGCYNW